MKLSVYFRRHILGHLLYIEYYYISHIKIVNKYDYRAVPVQTCSSDILGSTPDLIIVLYADINLSKKLSNNKVDRLDR